MTATASSVAPSLPELAGLDDEQRRAVLTEDRHALVLAGPGSGKTRVLVTRACLLARRGSGRVLMLTFTRKAAREMEQRATHLLPSALGKSIAARTIHEQALRLLEAHGHRIGLPSEIEPIDRRDVSVLAEKIARVHGIPLPPDFSARFERYQRRGADAGVAGLPELVGLVVSEMRRLGTPDWETTILLAIELLRQHEDVRSSFHHHTPFVLIDEAQDCDPAQLAFVEELVGGPAGPGELFVVMDPDQSLYGFRHADPDKVLAWIDRFSPVRFLLPENHRSKPRIQAFARMIVEPGGGSALEPTAAGLVSEYEASDRLDEARFVHTQIRERHEFNGVPLERMLVLARNRFRLDTVEPFLREQGIAVRADANVPLESREKELVLALAFVSSFRERSPVDAATRAFLERVAKLSQADVDAIEQRSLGGDEHPGAFLEIESWRTLRAWLEEQRHSPVEIVKRTAEVFALDLNEDDDVLILARRSATFADLMRALRAGRPADWKASARGLLITSFHGAKGLEFDVVIGVGCEDGLVPDRRSLTDDKKLREERRALYVAVTRASTEVIVTHVTQDRGWQQQRSRFLPPQEHPIWTHHA